MALRTDRLVDLAARYVGETTSKVYKGLLQVLEEKQARCFDDLESNIYDEDVDLPDLKFSATSAEILSKLDPTLDLSRELAPIEQNGTDGVFEVKDDEDEVFSASYSEAAANTKRRIKQIERHVRILCDDPRRFASWAGNTGGGQWRVRFRHLCKYLVQQVIEDIVLVRWGGQATRFIRMLHARGKLDEKQVCNYAMMKIKDTRILLRMLQEAGFVDAQEVPRDNTRQPSRTIYLWFYDQNRVRRMLVNDAYKCMARLLQRKDVERASIQPVLDKAERTDVGGDEEKWLNKMEQRALQQWEDKENRLLLQLARQDDVVAILRDFLPYKHSG